MQVPKNKTLFLPVARDHLLVTTNSNKPIRDLIRQPLTITTPVTKFQEEVLVDDLDDLKNRNVISKLPEVCHQKLVAQITEEVIHRDPPGYELVVARFEENLAWLSRVPDSIAITIYNKGSACQNLPERALVFSIPNIGRESHTMSLHCAAMMNVLADYTVFTQGDPFEHSPCFLELLEGSNPTHNQAMSCKYLNEVPPLNIQNKPANSKQRLEKFNMYTLDAMEFRDHGTQGFYDRYLKVNDLCPGRSVMHHYFGTLLGLDKHVSAHDHIGEFAYGAMIGVLKQGIQQHPPEIYVEIMRQASRDWCIGYVIERSWMLLFNEASTR